MASSLSCDGCGLHIDTATVIGNVIPRDYCPDCAGKATMFIEAHDFLRKEAFDHFTADRELLLARFADGGFLLPDVPI